MKKLLLAVMVVAMVFAVAGVSNAQEKMSLSVGADVLLPMGTFGDAFSIGFGGSVRGQYDFTPMLAGGVTVGYYSYSAKSIEGTDVKPKFSGLPIRVFGKYYFTPAGTGVRPYGMFELGLFFWSMSVSTPVVSTPFGTFGGEFSSTGSDLNYAPGIGVEIPASPKLKVDLSARYDGVATSGESHGSLGIRAGVNFGL